MTDFSRTSDYNDTSDYNGTIYDYNYSPTFCSPENSLLNHSAIPAMLYTVFAVGLVGNATVLWVLIRLLRLKNMTDVCLLNLALSDLLMVLSLPLWALNFQDFYFDSDIACKAKSGMYQVSFYSGILFVTVMSVDRYLAIVHAVAAMRARTRRYGVMASVVIWMVSICAALPEILFARVIANDDTRSCERDYPPESHKTWKKFRNISENMVGLFISLPVMIYCYVRILLVLCRAKNSKRSRAMKLVCGIVGAFIVFWVPYNVMVFLETLPLFHIENGFKPVDECETPDPFMMAFDLTEIISLTHCCVNPVIYAFAGEKFRKSLVSAFSRYPLFSKISGVTSHSKVSENETSNTAV
ncbi:C-C chemokine receptor type 8 [Chanos chanos]|uniref:C-C chemokine receptor type 8 n=1 Tax=Chanos chanos TaxID=29144 RepID=A0A6J2W4C9_CHACN|nr:C-C chemokine receptor type 8-like [Chanos chanos]